MNKKLSIIIILILFVVNLFAQYTITGIAVDSEQQPLEPANVVLSDLQSGKIIKGTTTNVKGEFQISFEETKCLISISYIGFQPWEKEIELTQNIDLGNIILNTSNNLDEVTITARKKIITNEGDKTIFNVHYSPLKEGYDIFDLLKVTPHVWMNVDNTLLMHGENVTLMVNERKVDISYLSSLKSDDISRIEVQTHQSANNDASTTGGIVNLVLKKNEKGTKARLTTFYTLKPKGYNTYSDMNIDYGTERWNMYGSYSFGRYDVFTNEINEIDFLALNNTIDTKTEKQHISDDHRYNVGFVSQINNNQEIGFEVYGNYSGYDNTRFGVANYFKDNTIKDFGNVDVLGDGKISTIAFMLNHKWTVSEKDIIKIYLEYYRQNSNDFNLSEVTYQNGSYDDNQNNYDSNAKTKIIALQLDYNKALRNKTNIDLGVKFSGTNRFSDLLVSQLIGTDFIEDSNQSTDINLQERISAAYLSFDKKMGKKNYLKVGIRMEYTDIDKIDFIKEVPTKKNYVSFFPSVFFSRNPTENQTLSLSYSRSLKRPNLFLLNENIEKVNDFQYYIGNPDLAPEFTDKYELKYMINDHSISAFHINTKDKINEIYIVDDEIAYFKTVNLGAQRRYGAEYGIKKSIKEWWFFSASAYLYNESYVDEHGSRLFLMTTYGGNISSKFEINETTSFDISGFYRSPSAAVFYKCYETYSLNLAFNKTFFDRKLNIRFDLYDVFNTYSFRTLREFETFEAYYKREPNRRAIEIELIYNISNNKKVSLKKNKSQNDVKSRI